MRGRSILGLILAFSLTASLWGCGEAPRQETAAGEVALLEPVGLTSSGEAAARRNLYDASIYSATVVPYVEEYAFEEDVMLDGFRAFPGRRWPGDRCWRPPTRRTWISRSRNSRNASRTWKRNLWSMSFRCRRIWKSPRKK